MALVRVRRAVASDAAELAELRLELQREAGLAGEEDRALLGDAYRAYFTARIPTGEFVAWVAKADGRLVATSGLVLTHRPPYPGNPSGLEAYVMNMYTSPGWRGRGLAKAILAELLRFIAGSPARRIWLHATAAGRPLYERAGFALVSDAGEMELRLP